MRKVRPFVHGETLPPFVTARTRHQYWPFGIASTSEALVFFVEKLSASLPSTGELKPASAAISKS